MGRDLIYLPTQQNLYNFVANNPTPDSDFLGLKENHHTEQISYTTVWYDDEGGVGFADKFGNDVYLFSLTGMITINCEKDIPAILGKRIAEKKYKEYYYGLKKARGEVNIATANETTDASSVLVEFKHTVTVNADFVWSLIVNGGLGLAGMLSSGIFNAETASKISIILSLLGTGNSYVGPLVPSTSGGKSDKWVLARVVCKNCKPVVEWIDSGSKYGFTRSTGKNKFTNPSYISRETKTP